MEMKTLQKSLKSFSTPKFISSRFSFLVLINIPVKTSTAQTFQCLHVSLMKILLCLRKTINFDSVFHFEFHESGEIG